MPPKKNFLPLGRIHPLNLKLLRANLQDANLSDADARGANLSRANLSRADLEGAEGTDEQLAQAGTLEGATLPDGTVHE